MKLYLLTIGGLVAANLYACATTPVTVAEGAPVPVADAQIAGETQTTTQSQPTEVLSESSIATPTPATLVTTTPEQRFKAWKRDFSARMEARYGPTARTLMDGASFQEHLLIKDSTQPEFTRPVWAYLDSALKDSRVGPGLENLELFSTTFSRIQGRYNVEPEYLAAIWGMESQYGAIMGDNDVVSALATFAFEGRRAEMFTEQLEALIELVAAGKLRTDQLKGAWAGAMGMTQFMPTTMRDYAVDFDGDGNIDLRGSEADALGSAAHYLSRFGWVPGQPAMVEVRLPEGFDFSLADGSTKRRAEDWAALGVAPVTRSGAQTVFPDNVAFADAKILIPAGARGPAFLTLKNFDVIKRYNNSTSYAMAISGLAETFKGNVPVVQPWPREDEQLSFEDKKALQQRLTDLGYATGGVDGRIGPNSRKAIRAWQRDQGLPADGYVEQRLFARIMGR